MTEPTIPIVCDMTGAPDTPEERLAEYRQLFAEHLIGRERTDDGIRFRFRVAPALEEQVRDLAAREHACCAFMTFVIEVRGDELWWSSSVVDDPLARQILDEMYQLPDTATESVAAMYHRFADQGLNFVTQEDGVVRPVTLDEMGATSWIASDNERS